MPWITTIDPVTGETIETELSEAQWARHRLGLDETVSDENAIAHWSAHLAMNEGLEDERTERQKAREEALNYLAEFDHAALNLELEGIDDPKIRHVLHKFYRIVTALQVISDENLL